MPMNPYSEKKLTEEVLHLHSLWRRGPPRNRKPISNHSATPVADTPNRNPSNKRPRDPKNRNHKKKKPRPEPPQDSGPEWPCPEPVQNQASTSSGWPAMEPPSSTPAAQTVSSEERANLAALLLQYKGFEACRRFFARNGDTGSDEDEDENEEEGNDGGIMESEEYKFFLGLFVENDELRVYYEKNSEDGSFCCLVCGGMGKRQLGKKFKSCVGLVQHSISISRTKKKRAHRAFGLVVCRVFGWDIDRLPMIVLKGEPLGRSLAESRDSKVQPEENHVAKEGDSGVQNENVAILNDNNDKKNEMISVDENEQRLEEEKTAEDPTCNAKDLISGEVDKKNEVISVDENEQKLEEEKTAEDPTSNAKDLISGENENGCKETADNSIPGMGESKAEMENLPVPQSILKACKEFFAGFSTSTSDDDVSENNLIDGDGLDEREEFKFFLKLFTENEGLRRYYENNYEDGEFFCLVCEGAGKKVLKSFKTCGRLLQHTASMAKNRIRKKLVHKPHIAKMVKMKMLAHRAYSLVICKVLGWDIEKLPAVVLKGEPLSQSLTMPSASKDESVGNAVGDTNESNDPIIDESTKIGELQDESVGNAVGNTDAIIEDNSTQVKKLQGETVGNAVGNINDLDDLKENETMKVNSNGEAVLKDDSLM